jgi:hypothetical protein
MSSASVDEWSQLVLLMTVLGPCKPPHFKICISDGWWLNQSLTMQPNNLCLTLYSMCSLNELSSSKPDLQHLAHIRQLRRINREQSYQLNFECTVTSIWDAKALIMRPRLSHVKCSGITRCTASKVAWPSQVFTGRLKRPTGILHPPHNWPDASWHDWQVK